MLLVWTFGGFVELALPEQELSRPARCMNSACSVGVIRGLGGIAVRARALMNQPCGLVYALGFIVHASCSCAVGLPATWSSISISHMKRILSLSARTVPAALHAH